MQKEFLKKYLNAFLALAVMAGLQFLNPIAVFSFKEIVPEYSTGIFNVADAAEGDLAFYNASRGFFLLPLSANNILDDALPAVNPTPALIDTIILADSSANKSGLVIYRVDGTLWVNTFVGAGNESAHSASYFGVGDFVIVMTAGPDQCADLTLSECRLSQYFLKETPFSIQ